MPRIPLHEAARRLGAHPLTVAFRLASLTDDFADCWPDVEDGYVETLKSMSGTLVVAPHPEPAPRPAAAIAAPSSQNRTLSLGTTAVFVVEKLYRKNRWGKFSVSYTSLRHMCHNPKDLNKAIDELRRADLLIVEGHDKAFSLDPGRKGDIEAIAAKHGWKKG